MEALIASAILFAGVLAVISAITSGQQKAFEAEQQVMATLAAEELMGITFNDIDEDLFDLGVVVRGKTVNVEIYPSMTDMRLILELAHFIPKPQS
ncbi:MAG: type IV pilus modification PilV family protein [Planctomycetota bacterium]|jgi:hypothetical protein